MIVVADTGAIVALIDANDANHHVVRELFEESGDHWVLPWAILPEVDYLLGEHVSEKARRAFVRDVAEQMFAVEWGDDRDVLRAQRLCERYRALRLGLVDGVVAAMSERLRASAIVTLDLRDFGPLVLEGSPALLPRDR